MKKSLVITSLLTLLCSAPLVGTATATPRILHHALQVTLEPMPQTLRAQDTLTIKSAGARKITLTLAPTARIESLHVNGEPAQYDFARGRLTLSLPSKPEIELNIIYRATFDAPPPEKPLHNEDPTYGVTASINESGTFLSGHSGWYPDIPGSLATFAVEVDAPAGTVAVTSGRLAALRQADGRSVTAWETAPLPSLTLAAGTYVFREANAGGIPVYTFFRPETDGLAETYLQAARRYLALYQGLFGPYPFEKFAVVENFFPTGYGFPSWTLLGSSVVRLPFIVETSLGHEIAHSWWGTGVRVGPGGNWAEGLTTYVADHLYKELDSVQAGREYRLKLLRDYATLVPPEEDFPLTIFSGRTSAGGQAVGYGKAAMVFHMIRTLVGDQAFWAGLRQVTADRLFTQTSWRDLTESWEALSGKDLNAFLAALVERSGAPQLGLEGVVAQRDGANWTVRGTLVQRPPYFDLSVPLRLETAGGALEATVGSKGAHTAFTLACADAPTRLSLDPEADLFRRLDPAELPPTVNALRGSRRLLVVTSDALGAGALKAAGALLHALRQEGAEVVSESALPPGAQSGRDILFLGLPTDPALRPTMPAGLEVASGHFLLDGQRFADSGSALFAALPHPEDPDRTAGLFHPLSASAAEAAARKIPHYGKYSYLAFDGGRNRVKGTWPPGPSPAVHIFDPEEVSR